MAEPMIQDLIREVLAEELAKLRPQTVGAAKPSQRLESVRIASDADLTAFVQMLLDLTADPKARQALLDRDHVFRLDNGSAVAPAVEPVRAGHRHSIERGLLSERQVDQLPRHTTTVLIGAAVRLTPLARDRLRQRGIAIERME